MGSELDQMLGRIDAEFVQSKDRIERLKSGKADEDPGRLERLKRFEKACDSLRAVWRPRLEALKQKFGDKARLSPKTGAGMRSATFEFLSELAKITLVFSASTDPEVKTLVLDYRLDLVPVLMTFSGKDRMEQPLDKLDPAAVGTWVEDRIVDFVKTYLSLHENEYYLKAHMVEDPVAKVRFPKFAAAATLERDGKTIYFISDETRGQFEKASKAP